MSILALFRPAKDPPYLWAKILMTQNAWGLEITQLTQPQYHTVLRRDHHHHIMAETNIFVGRSRVRWRTGA